MVLPKMLVLTSTRGGQSGVFATIVELVAEHSQQFAILPHAFVAIGNLAANHAPNQAICGREDVVELCVRMLQRPDAGAQPQIVYTILSCLNAVVAEQEDNLGPPSHNLARSLNLQRALLTSQGIAGSRYRCEKSA